MTLYPLVLEMKKLLGHMNGWIDKAEAHAGGKTYDANTLLQARLAPDMFPLVRQFQNACDTAKFAAAFTTGKEPPSHPDTEQTFAEVRTRIASVIEYLGTFTEADFEGADRREVKRPALGGQVDARHRLLRRAGAPELLLPSHHGLRHPPPQRRGPREAGLHR